MRHVGNARNIWTDHAFKSEGEDLRRSSLGCSSKTDNGAERHLRRVVTYRGRSWGVTLHFAGVVSILGTTSYLSYVAKYS